MTNSEKSAGEPLSRLTSPSDENMTQVPARHKAEHVTEEDKNAEKEKGASMGDFIRIFHYADRLDFILYAIAFIGAIANGAALPLMTLVLGQSISSFNNFAVGEVDEQQFLHSIDHLVLYFVYLFVARFVIGYVSTLSICVAAARTTRSLRKAFFESLLRQEVSYFDKQGTGSAATQVTTNGVRVNQGIAEKLYAFVQGIGLFFSAYIVALVIQWKLALITMSIVPATVFCIGAVVALDAPIEARITRIYSAAAVLAQDAISSIKTVHAFRAHPKIVAKYDDYLKAAHTEGKKKSLLFGVMFSIQTFLVLAGTALAFWEGFRLYQSGEITNVGTVFTVVLSVTLGATSVITIIPQLQAVTNAASAAAELLLTIDRVSLLDPLAKGGKEPASCAGEISIRDLHFAYPTRSTVQVLRGLNLLLPAGKTTALVGPSGCGKSTLVGLLERWYEPTSGQILIDGQNITEYGPKWLRSRIRLVQQEPTLFEGTIFQNVAKGLVGEQLTLPKEQQMRLVIEACEASNAHDFVQDLPESYETRVGQRASMLSGGQRQRLAIARSIISDPKILLLDEATSALDPRAEKVVQDALHRVSASKTTLIIAHKLATVMAADNIAVMNNGTIVEQGTHRELLQLDGLYAAMVRAQDLNAGSEKLELPETMDESESKNTTLQRTSSEGLSKDDESEIDNLTAGTMEYSLLRCVFAMLLEHPDLYFWYAVMAFGCIISGITYPAQGVIFSHLIKVFTLQGSEAKQQANFYALMFFVLALANLVTQFCMGWASNTIGQHLTHRTRKEMIERILSYDQDFFDYPQNSSGAITSRLSSVPAALLELMSLNLGLILGVVVNIVASSILGIAFGWKLGLVIVLGGLSVIVAAGYIRIRLDQNIEKITEDLFANSAGLTTEAVASIRTVSSLTLESAILRQYNENVDGVVSKVIKSMILTLIPHSLSQSADFLVMGLGFWYGSQLVARREYTITQFFVIFTSVVFGGQATSQLFGYSTSISKAAVSANYLFWLRNINAAEICETDENRDRGPAGEGPAALENVHFRYKQRDGLKVLRGISMNIKPGTYAAIVGPSGCGKSTIISLLERFYDATSGRLTLNGIDIASMSPSKYRRYMSLVQQEPPLYQGSVRENIAIGLEHNPTDEEVEEACRQANAWDFVSSLPEGLDTPCGVKGLQFSGGQRQRIAVARALIRKPRLLLLDEATSALDTQSERIVQKALDAAASTRTTIAVAHRLSTIRHADVIFVLETGKIVEMGTHEELQRLRGRYYAMCLTQSLDQSS